jgi:transposase-like protein
MAASDAAPGLVNLSGLMDDAKCFAFVRQHRWPEGVRCPECDTAAVIRDGCDDSQPHRQRYRCKGCARRFDDLTGTGAGRASPAATGQGHSILITSGSTVCQDAVEVHGVAPQGVGNVVDLVEPQDVEGEAA